MCSLAVRDFRPLLESCGYRGPLLVDGFPLNTAGEEAVVPLVGFAHEPLDAGSACIAVLASQEDPAETVGRHRSLGAPVLFTIYQQSVQWWAQGTDGPRHLETFPPEGLPRFFDDRRSQLAPEAVYRAKTRGRFEAAYQLDFVDVGLMPLLEEEMGEKLGSLVERAVSDAASHLPPRSKTEQVPKWLPQAVFWLLAGKILKDKRVRGFGSLDLSAVDNVFARVAAHYGAEAGPLALQARNGRRALEAAAAVFARFTSLAHVTPEALSSVYETALVSKETRKALGIHSTPSFLTRYVVWRLAAWIEEIPAEDRHVFEPTCGQGSFLVAAMRLLRDLLPAAQAGAQRKAYLRRHLHGVDIDPFAVELARLSLTLADVPNPDGWDLGRADVFTELDLTAKARVARIFLANPPFESFSTVEKESLTRADRAVRAGSKTTELLRRMLPNLAPGAVFGVVVPQGFLHSRSAGDVRSMMLENFEIAEVSLFPDKVFRHSEAECALLLGRTMRRSGTMPGAVRYLRVRETEVERFRSTYSASSELLIPQTRFVAIPDHRLTVPELQEVWQASGHLPRLEAIAEVGKGLEHKSDLPPGTITISERRFGGAARGFARPGRDLRIDRQPRKVWLNLDPAVLRRSGTGNLVGAPQVIVNYVRVSRGPWRLKAILDPEGHATTSNFLAVRPRQADVSLLYLWSLLNSPFANAYCVAHATKHHVLKQTLHALPVPSASFQARQRVERAAEAYLRVVRGERDEWLAADPEPGRACAALLTLDAEVLRLYDLSPRLERQLLDLFAGWRRPGVPFDFERYFPVDFEPWIPLHIYLSSEFQRSNAGELRRHSEPAPDVAVGALREAVKAFEE